MERLKRFSRGLSLLELIIAIVLFSVVLVGASSLLVSFGKFSFLTVKSDAALIGTALGTFEEIASRVRAGNKVRIRGTTTNPKHILKVRIDIPNTPANPNDDTVYKYWIDGTQLKYKSKVESIDATGDDDDETEWRVIAKDITYFDFYFLDGTTNKIKLIMRTVAADGSKETLETTAVLRSRSANLP